MTSPSLAGLAGSLPGSLTTFVGRSRELAEISALLADPEIRLITLTGPGGVGKTRLASEVADLVFERFPDGVYFVSLASLASPEFVLPAISQCVGIRDVGADEQIRRLESFLAERRMLLVLDNFEHVIDAALQLSEILARCPGVTVLATSRVRLRVSGEHQYPVKPLSIESGATSSQESRDAVRLFVERARAVAPGFSVTAENAQTLIDICRRLDGLPLAIELAAARVNVLPPAALLARLGRRLPLLTGGGRDLPERHQTMRDTIRWSYELLGETERRIFERLSIFHSGFTLEMAEAVVHGASEWNADLLETISSLVDSNLIRLTASVDAEPRFEMLGTIREFAHDQLLTSGDADLVRARHAGYWFAFAEAAEPHLLGRRGDQARWLARVDTELGNIRQALAWFEETGDAESLLRVIGVLDLYWSTRPAQADPQRWARLALAPGKTIDPLIRIRALHALTYLAAVQGLQAVAANQGAEQLRLARESGDPLGLGIACVTNGMVADLAGDGYEAARLYVAALDHLRTADKNEWLRYGLANAADALHWIGKPDDARPLIEEAISLTRQLDDLYGLGGFLGIQGHIVRRQGDLKSAVAHFLESFQTAGTIGDDRAAFGAIAGLAGIALALNQPERAARLLGAVDVAREAAGYSRIMHGLQTDRITAETRERLGEPAFGAALDEGRRLDWPDTVADALSLRELVDEPKVGPSQLPFGLSPRELDVLRFIARGCSDREIADQLFIGVRTVNSHVANLLAKLGVHNRSEAAVFAATNGIR
jgi:predicted ATPase/DNA-binding CsgD family transcriptional regulator